MKHPKIIEYDENINFKQMVLDEGVLVIRNYPKKIEEKNCLFVSRNLLKGEGLNMYDNTKTLKWNENNGGLPVVRKISKTYFLHEMKVPWHSEVSVSSDVLISALYGLTNVNMGNTFFCNTTKLLKNYFNNDIDYLKSVKMKVNNKVILGSPSLEFGWGWHLPCNFNKISKLDSIISPLLIHSITKEYYLRLDCLHIIEILEDNTGLFSKCVDELQSFSGSFNSNFSNEYISQLKWNDTDIAIWDNSKMIHCRPKINIPDESDRELLQCIIFYSD